MIEIGVVNSLVGKALERLREHGIEPEVIIPNKPRGASIIRITGDDALLFRLLYPEDIMMWRER